MATNILILTMRHVIRVYRLRCCKHYVCVYSVTLRLTRKGLLFAYIRYMYLEI